MPLRNRLSPALLASALGLGLLPLVGCMKPSNDKGDNASVGTGTERPAAADIDAAKTGGLGGTRNNQSVGPGGTGVRNDSPPVPSTEPAPK